MTIIGQAHSYVSLTTTGNDAEVIGLYKTIVALRRKAQHNLA